MRVGVLGAGKVGVSLGKYIVENGTRTDLHLQGYYSRKESDAAAAASFTRSHVFASARQAVEDCDLIFLTVPDGRIAQLAGELKSLPVEGKFFCHASGALSADVMQCLRERGAMAASLHPICAVSDRFTGYRELEGCCFTVEGDPALCRMLRQYFEQMGNFVGEISGKEKVRYHMAAVFASNLVLGLYDTAAQILRSCGLEEDFSARALAPLFLKNAARAASDGVEAALTGPVERGDAETVRRHLEAARGDEAEIYRLLSRRLADIARRKHPEREDGALLEILGEEKGTEL